VSDAAKAAAKILEVASDVIEDRCEAILKLALTEADLQDVAPAVKSELVRRFGPTVGPVSDIRAQLRELRRLAGSLRSEP
jgi:hypothetical protein